MNRFQIWDLRLGTHVSDYACITENFSQATESAVSRCAAKGYALKYGYSLMQIMQFKDFAPS